MLNVKANKRKALETAENKKKLEKTIEKILENWNNPEFLTMVGEEYIKKSEEITEKELRSWQKSVYIWIRHTTKGLTIKK